MDQNSHSRNQALDRPGAVDSMTRSRAATAAAQTRAFQQAVATITMKMKGLLQFRRCQICGTKGHWGDDCPHRDAASLHIGGRSTAATAATMATSAGPSSARNVASSAQPYRSAPDRNPPPASSRPLVPGRPSHRAGPNGAGHQGNRDRGSPPARGGHEGAAVGNKATSPAVPRILTEVRAAATVDKRAAASPASPRTRKFYESLRLPDYRD
ncbi:hypothetical protein GGTG_02549 [Gaeumannomyces tritici R3-111a-1]|uniref:CCHC-type domain-containing protein n=1 Tax=Gaeumannomyces tritici (strain R3-111a-1) TaxID=644352 RepID=J3NMP3_GAET3|nr:hypothetical protein GGTG_02549 [Gaeumannomyces tritici R3-111a-1]EJT82576.1 hypothetical protein GGTG_02549 [Gaeumannomyces tritici R3-111a-1]